MDDADRAGEYAELFDREARCNAAKRNDRPSEIGYCHFCMEKIVPGVDNKVFCDADCAKDWEKEEAAIKRGNWP